MPVSTSESAGRKVVEDAEHERGVEPFLEASGVGVRRGKYRDNKTEEDEEDEGEY